MTPQVLAALVLLFPAGGAVVLGFWGWRWPRTLTKVVGPGVVWASFVCVLGLLWWVQNGGCRYETCYLKSTGAWDMTYWTWISSGSFTVPMNLLIDQLSVFMGLVITGVGALIVTYAVGYMSDEDDAGYARFFCYMDLFVLSMLLLVLAGNFVILIVGWAGVGLSSYLLIGFYYWRQSAVLAARKAFVMNVIGDIGMILAAFAIWFSYHGITYAAVFKALPGSDNSTLELIGFLLLVGAVAKSAQLPLHTWLPDAMEGPTPVSALIHAATMVTAGVYLVGRMHPIYDVAWLAHNSVAIVGAASALFAATVAVVQFDIKRVLAYSTMSQIGYMFMAVGIGAYSAGFFHLLSHAFFKALLFMAAGNVIHAMKDDQDMRHYGGLREQLPFTSRTFLVGSLSLVGILPFVGFFSKESILGAAFSRGDSLGWSLWVVGAGAALLTGFYTGRMWYMAFKGRPSPERPVEHPHEAPRVMAVPVGVLAVLTSIGGAVQITALWPGGWRYVTDFLGPAVRDRMSEAGLGEVVASLGVMALGGLLFAAASNFYVTGTWSPAVVSARLPALYRLLVRKWYFDELYDAVFVRPMDAIARASQRLDRPVIDGPVRRVGSMVEAAAGELSLTQTGYFRNYILVFVAGAVVTTILVLVRAST
jgi:NADH-quinone oxidoreductase subunit L